MRETITAAAISIEGVCLSLPLPARHPHVLNSAMHFTTQERILTATQGFITSAGRFVNRTQAFQIAWLAKQIISDRDGPELFSEDVW